MHWRKNLFHARKVVWALNNYNGRSSYQYVIERHFYFWGEIELDNTKSYYADIGCLTEAAFLSTVWRFFFCKCVNSNSYYNICDFMPWRPTSGCTSFAACFQLNFISLSLHLQLRHLDIIRQTCFLHEVQPNVFKEFHFIKIVLSK